MNEEKKIKYLESTINRLEKENEQLKQDKQSLELQLTAYLTEFNTATDKAKELLTALMESKKLSDELLSELKVKSKEVTTLSREVYLLQSKMNKPYKKEHTKPPRLFKS